MRSIQVPYRFVLGRSELLPLCDVFVIGRTARARVTALLDSGANYPCLPQQAAEDAGLDLPSAPNFAVRYGAGMSPGRLVRSYIELAGRRWATEVVFVERLDFPYGLLGRRGIFSRFNEVVFLEGMRSPRVELRW